MSASWIYLLLAGCADAVYGIALYYAKGFTRPGPSLLSIAGGLLGTWLLSMAMKGLPLGVSFAVWCGLASIMTVLYGMVMLGEARDPVRLGLMALVIGGIVGLKLTSAG